jgi:hypothetical protein
MPADFAPNSRRRALKRPAALQLHYARAAPSPASAESCVAFLVLSLLIQAALIVHVIKSGRNTLWIWAIALLPMAGPLAYVAVELLPQLFRGTAARRARSGVQRILDPDRGLRRAGAEVAISGNLDARRRLAEELYERGKFDGAIEVYAAGLTGIFEHDPTLLLGKARAEFTNQKFAAARATLERLKLNNPEFKSTEARLLYARTLEAEGALLEAEREYASIAPDYPGAEARLRFGMLLKRLGKAEQARSELGELLDSALLSPPHYRRAQAEWLDLARRELR